MYMDTRYETAARHGVARIPSSHNAKEAIVEQLFIGQYVLALVVGFGSQPLELRARVERIEDGIVFVRTADLRDAGSFVPVYADRVRPEPAATVEVVRHRRALTWIG